MTFYFLYARKKIPYFLHKNVQRYLRWEDKSQNVLQSEIVFDRNFNCPNFSINQKCLQKRRL